MPEQPLPAGAVDEAEEVLDVVLPTANEASEVAQPGESSFDLAVTAQVPSILTLARRWRLGAIRPMP